MITENKLNKIISESIEKVLMETSRRQKAISTFLGVDNKVKTFGIITAENPMGKQFDAQENKNRNNMLKSFFSSKQYAFCPVKGKYGNIEHPFMVYNVSLEDMKIIGRTFDQESFIYAEIENNNSQPHVIFSFYKKDYSENEKKLKLSQKEYHFIESKDVYVKIDNDANEDFTAIGRNFKFSIPFDIFCESIYRFNRFVNERCDKSEAYNLSCERLIEESIENRRTDRSRRLRRAQLYGKNFEKFL